MSFEDDVLDYRAEIEESYYQYAQKKKKLDKMNGSEDNLDYQPTE
jgi:hypothetical protein